MLVALAFGARESWRSPRAIDARQPGTISMDLGDTTEEAAFRAEARAWLEHHVERRKPDERIYADGKLVGEERSKGLDYEGGGGTKATLGSLREFGEHLRGELAELVLLDGAESRRRISVERALAENAGLTGTFLAWNSTDSDSPADRFFKSNDPYVRVDGVRVAQDYTDLTDGELDEILDATRRSLHAA